MSGYLSTEEISVFLPLDSQMNNALPPYTVAICIHIFTEKGILAITIHGHL